MGAKRRMSEKGAEGAGGASSKASKAEAKSNPVPAPDNRAQQSLMLTTLKRSVADPEISRNRKQVLDLYSELPRFSEEKQAILSMWVKDKSCKWVSEYKMVRSNQVDKIGGQLDGHGTMYDLAKVINQDPESATFKQIIENMPHDMDWDLNVPLEAAYHKAGLKRYRIQKTEIDQVKYTESCKEELTKSTSKVQSEKLTGMKELLGKAEVQIKIENPDSQSLKESKKVLLSAETKLNQLASTIKKDAATLKAKGSEECLKKHAELLPIVGLLNGVVEQITEAIAQAEEVNHEDGEAVAKALGELGNLKMVAEDHMDAAKAKRTKVRQFLSALSSSAS